MEPARINAMNRFFTLLLAASCLNAIGQTDYVPDSVLEEGGWELVLEREGQQYWLFDEDREWEDARAMCAEFGAYLYWPNSLEEHLDVWASVPNGNDGVHYWTAIHQDFSQVVCDSEEGWAGPNGEPQTFFHWDDGQPNNGDGESVVQFEWSDWGATWNDAPGQECDGNDQCSCRMSRVILERTSLMEGCVDQNACNFNPDADVEDGSCHFLCQYCKEGTVWDEAIQGCVVANPADINFDGCVQLNDLLDLLSAYGDCGAEESVWQCGDPLEYQGYDYETVLIGEQCWFAENLRANNYRNGDEIVSNLNDSEWEAYTQGASTIYDNDLSNLESYGRLFNSYAVEDIRGLCPQGWKVPSDLDWMALEVEIGMSQEEAESTQLRGTDQGAQLRAEFGWLGDGNESNLLGFSALPGGTRDDDGSFSLIGQNGFWWSSTPVESSLWYRRIDYNGDGIFRWYVINQPDALSVRCIKDSE